MSSKVRIADRAVAIIVATLFVAMTATVASATINKQEQKCLSKLGKSAVKLATTYAKGTGKCLNADISGKTVGACPDAKGIAKNAKAAAKVVSSAEKSCFSTCSTDLSTQCVTDFGCPPPAGGCTAGAKGILFDIDRINFPGPYCDNVGVASIGSPTDIGTCTSGLSEQAGVDLIAAIFGTITNASGISAGAASCLASIDKTAQKLTSTVAKSILKCRDSINKGKLSIDPAGCEVDVKTAAKIDKANTKLLDTIADKCDDGQITELDICGNGVGGTTTVGDAQSCLSAAAHEVGNSNDPSVDRTVAAVTIIESAMPPDAACGDNSVNAGPSAAQPLGEECDGVDDGACPGECLPPGGIFECTCGDRARWRFEADASITDSDAGWTGPAMDQKVGDRAGYTVTLLNCDCSAFTDATCTGVSVDSVCDVVGTQRPFCDWEVVAGPHCEGDVSTENDPCVSSGDCGTGTCVDTPACDSRALNPNLVNKDSDCFICDTNSTSPGSACEDDTDCGSQCFPVAGGAATGGCVFASDCSSEEVCLGRCDSKRQCIVTRDGSPFPVVAANAAVCSQTAYRENIFGTLDIVTGQHLLSNSAYSVQHLGESLSRPCPVCGGMCDSGLDENKSCTGRCRNDAGTGSLDSCRFDSDCVALDETCSSISPDCREGSCALDSVCMGLPNTPSVANNTACEIFFVDPTLGALSTQCEADPAKNITGLGFPIDYVPGQTTHPVVWAATEACTAAGFELFDCHCPGAGGQPSKPNNCNPTCDAGANFLQSCGGIGTTCLAGTNAGAACDEDSDCPGGACNANPLACAGDSSTCFATGGPCSNDSDCPMLGERCNSLNGQTCTTNGDCGIGTCGDACPGGRCLPLCTPRPGDLDDGICAINSRTDYYHCTGQTGITCVQADADAALLDDCSAVCSGSLASCGSIEDCPLGETCDGPCPARKNCEAGGDGILGGIDDKPGAGDCGRFVTNCQPDPIMIEGGTTLNGLGDSTNVYHVGRWCFIGTNSAAVNAASGFPGPGTIERKGNGYISVTSIP
jgi:hypothetical protein